MRLHTGLLSAPPCLSQLPQRSTVSQDMVLNGALVLATCIRLPCFSIKAHPSLRGPTESTASHPGPTGSHPGPPGSLFSDRVPHPVSVLKFNTQRRGTCRPDHFPNGVGNCLWHGSPLSATRTPNCVDSSQRATVPPLPPNCTSQRLRPHSFPPSPLAPQTGSKTVPVWIVSKIES